MGWFFHRFLLRWPGFLVNFCSPPPPPKNPDPCYANTQTLLAWHPKKGLKTGGHLTPQIRHPNKSQRFLGPRIIFGYVFETPTPRDFFVCSAQWRGNNSLNLGVSPQLQVVQVVQGFLLKTNIAPPKVLLKMIFLFRRWDMLLVPCRVVSHLATKKFGRHLRRFFRPGIASSKSFV